MLASKPQMKDTTCWPPGPNQKTQHAGLQAPIESHAFTPFQARSKEARKSRIEGCCSLDRKGLFSLLYFVFVFTFSCYSKWNNSVGYLSFCILLLLYAC